MSTHKQPTPPLGRTAEVLDWDHVEPRHTDSGRDGLGLSPHDRKALGLSAPHTTELQAPGLGGAEIALADVLARSGASPRLDTRRKR